MLSRSYYITNITTKVRYTQTYISSSSRHLLASNNKSFTVTPFDKSWSQRDLHTSLQNLNKLYSSKHEWVEVVKGDVARVGMTEYAVDALGDVVFAQLPRETELVEAGHECGAVESVKVSDVESVNVFLNFLGSYVSSSHKRPLN